MSTKSKKQKALWTYQGSQYLFTSAAQAHKNAVRASKKLGYVPLVYAVAGNLFS